MIREVQLCEKTQQRRFAREIRKLKRWESAPETYQKLCPQRVRVASVKYSKQIELEVDE